MEGELCYMIHQVPAQSFDLTRCKIVYMHVVDIYQILVTLNDLASPTLCYLTNWEFRSG